MQATQGVKVNEATSLSIAVVPCNRSAYEQFDRWSLGSSLRHEIYSGYGLSLGYHYQQTRWPGSSQEQKTWQQVDVERAISGGTGFAALRLEQRDFDERDGDIRLHLRAGVSGELGEQFRFTASNRLLISSDAPDQVSRSSLSENTTAFSILGSLSSGFDVVFSYEYKHRFQAVQRASHEINLSMNWRGGHFRVFSDFLGKP